MSDGNKFVIAEAIALRIFPDHHAWPMNIYAGKGALLSHSGWVDLYQEMMGKPTGMPKEQWHMEFLKKKENK